MGGPALPRYDYQCTACDHRFELTQSFSDAGTGTCPQCAAPGRRVFHAVPVIYKGSGFYTTDYGRPKAPAENREKDADAADTNGKSADTAQDSPPAKTDAPAPAAASSPA